MIVTMWVNRSSEFKPRTEQIFPPAFSNKIKSKQNLTAVRKEVEKETSAAWQSFHFPIFYSLQGHQTGQVKYVNGIWKCYNFNHTYRRTNLLVFSKRKVINKVNLLSYITHVIHRHRRTLTAIRIRRMSFENQMFTTTNIVGSRLPVKQKWDTPPTDFSDRVIKFFSQFIPSYNIPRTLHSLLTVWQCDEAFCALSKPIYDTLQLRWVISIR